MINKSVLVCLTMLTLSACGGSGGGSDTPTSTPRNTTYSNLYNDTVFAFAFDNSSTVHGYASSFNDNDLVQPDDELETVLDGEVVPFVSVAGGPISVVSGVGNMRCVFLQENVNQFLCAGRVGAGNGVDLFLFPRLVNGESLGMYEYCLPSTTFEQCGFDIVINPDGDVSVANSLSRNALDFDKMETTTLQSKQAYVDYDKQGTVNSYQQSKPNAIGHALERLLNQ